jgi:hypothetical protein
MLYCSSFLNYVCGNTMSVLVHSNWNLANPIYVTHSFTINEVVPPKFTTKSHMLGSNHRPINLTETIIGALITIVKNINKNKQKTELIKATLSEVRYEDLKS